MNIAILTLIPFAVSVFVCWLMIRIGPKDGPDGARKSQAAPVASSGGTGILMGLIVGLLAAGFLNPPLLTLLVSPPLAGASAFLVLAGWLGWADDVLDLPASAKLAALLAGAAGAAAFGPQPATLWIAGGGYAIPVVAGAAISAIFIFVMANAVNFMDGANGIAMGCALIILAALALMLVPDVIYSPGMRLPGALLAVLMAAVPALAGFLVWNLPGRLFAGDTGSLSVGGLIGGVSMLFAINGPLLVPLTLCLPILVDVFMTLLWRARQGRPLMQAHRDHAYQLLLRSGWAHGRVARLWWGLTAVCAAAVIAGPLAVAAGVYGAHGGALDVIVFAVLLAAGCGLWVWQRARLGRRLAAEGK